MYITQKTQCFPTKDQQSMLSNMFGFRRLILDRDYNAAINIYKEVEKQNLYYLLR